MAYVSEAKPDWRREKRTSTRRRVRAHALRLFCEQGYDATTVEQIAAAAGVSHVTFFRYFPTKEDVVLSDDYDPLITALLAQTPAERPVPQRIRDALLQGLAEIYETERDALLAQNQLIAATPALRSRLWGDQMATQQLLLDALGPSPADQGSRLRARVTVAACLAAATTAVLTWADNNGTPELPQLINQAFDALARLEQGNRTPPAT